jgi:hypothetical protein
VSAADSWFEHRPKAIAMVGLGPSANAYWLECASWNTQVPWDEVWVVNKASKAFMHDVVFNMHDLRVMSANSNAPTERLRLMEADRPIVTVQEYPEFPMSLTFPIKEVVDFVKHDILSSTPAYMLAYAMMIGVKTIYLYGMDFHFTNVPHAEKGGQGMAYLLGMCQVMNIDFKIPNTSSLLAANECVQAEGVGILRPLYGYSWDGKDAPRDFRITNPAVKIIQPKVVVGDGQMSVDNTPRYRLGEGDIGDLNPDGAPQAPGTLPAVPTEKQA